MREDLKSRLKGKVLILGMGNRLRSDDGAGSVLAGNIKGRVPFVVFDAEESPENYLEKIIKDKPDTIVIVDTVDFGARPGEFRFLQAQEVKTANLFATHNASISLTINYLQSNLKADIIILIIQPKSINLGDKLSPQVAAALNELKDYFYAAGKTQR